MAWQKKLDALIDDIEAGKPTGIMTYRWPKPIPGGGFVIQEPIPFRLNDPLGLREVARQIRRGK